MCDSLNTSRHSYYDTDENLLQADFECVEEKVRLDSRMQLKFHDATQLFDSESSRTEIENLFDEAEKRARVLSKCLRDKISLVLSDFDSALAESGIQIDDPDHNHNLTFETYCSLYQGLYEIVEMTVQHLICMPKELVDCFDPEKIVVTKALILDTCKQYFNLVHISSYSFISCSHECPIQFNHAKVVKFVELLLQPIEDVKFMIKCLNSLAVYIGQVLDPNISEHEELLYITTTYCTLDKELDELTGYPDFIPVHLNLQIKFDEIRHKESHQMKCLQTVKLHLEELRLFSSAETQPYVLPEVLNINVYRNFLLHPTLLDMVFGNCISVVEVHEKLLSSLDHGFVEFVNQMPELTAKYCQLISQHYEDYREIYGALIGEVVFTCELIDILATKCPEFAYFLKHMAEKSQKTLTPLRGCGRYSITSVYQNIARHIMSYSNFFAVIEDLCRQKTSSKWESAIEQVKICQSRIRDSIKYLNDVTEARCLTHSSLGTIAELPLCALFSRGQNLRLPPTLIKFGLNTKPKDESLLYFFSGLIEIAQKRRPYSLLLATKDDHKTQTHCFHLHLKNVSTWKISKQSSNLVKIIPACDALCSLVVPSNVMKVINCRHSGSSDHASSNGGTVNGGGAAGSDENSKSTILLLKFNDQSLLDSFLSKLSSDFSTQSS